MTVNSKVLSSKIDRYRLRAEIGFQMYVYEMHMSLRYHELVLILITDQSATTAKIVNILTIQIIVL